MSSKIIFITTGDTDGIGLEVSCKALHYLGPQQKSCFVLWRGLDASIKNLSLIDKKFSRITVNTWPQAKALLAKKSHKKNTIIDIASTESPAKWVEVAAQACNRGETHALVTAPLSKPLIKSTFPKDLGHTEILKRVTRSKKVFMAFIGNKFNVACVTGHTPINEVSKHLSISTVAECARLSFKTAKLLKKRGPLAVVGLNPHAGDSGLIGLEDLVITARAVELLKQEGLPVEGPLVPDVAFQVFNQNRYSFYVCMYHDQGLIPFKMVHGWSGAHLTLGLPFIRTSVDHGTAKDIFEKNIADPSSMVEAIKLAQSLLAKG